MTEKDKDFLEGLAISAACHVLPVRKVFHEPIAYSYNGVILPKLPEWDKTVYPYAMIIKSYSGYELYCSIKEATNKLNPAGTAYFITFPQGTDNEVLVCRENSGTWSNGVVQTDVYLATGVIATVVWANYDFFNDNGSVYLSASEPIPVYE